MRCWLQQYTEGLARAGGQPDTDGIANSIQREQPGGAFSRLLSPSPQAVFFFPEVAVSDTFL